MRIKLIGLLIAFCAVGQVFGQQLEISGEITDQDFGQTFPGVGVRVAGTQVGVYSDGSGKYSINAQATDSLVFTFVGFTSQTIAINNRTTINVQLRENTEEIGEAVVTALGVSREKKSLGYAVGEVDMQSATENRDANVVNSMQGKVAGVVVTKTSGGPGASSRVVIRGNSSIANDNQPLVVVDGIPIDNNTIGTGGTWGGIDYGSPISDINPDDIESMVVLKGPSAAALYGSRALNGVIVITTKSGTGGKSKWAVSLNSNTSVESAYILKDFQNEYGAGSNGQFKLGEDGIPIFETNRPSTPTFASSWGPRMEGQVYRNWNGEVGTYSPQPNNYRDFFQTGYTATDNIAISKSGKIPFRLSISDLRNRGLTPLSTFKRNNATLNSNGKISEKLSYGAKVSFSLQRAFNRINQSNGDNAARNIILMPRNVSLASLQENFTKPNGQENTWYQDWGWIGNPYFGINRNINSDARARVIGNLSLKYKIYDWLSVMGRSGQDVYGEARHSRFDFNSFIVPQGQFNNQEITFFERNNDFLLSASRQPSANFEINFDFGGNRMYQRREINTVNGNRLLSDGIYEEVNVAPDFLDKRDLLFEKKINALYGNLRMRINRYLFLDFTGRNDWTSTLPKGNNSYFYPSASASYVFTDHKKVLPEILSFGKVRGAVAQVGKDADPYLLQLVYDSLLTVDGVSLYQAHNPFPLTNLMPERKNSLEFGLDLRFFDGRLNFDFTWYNELTKNQIIDGSPVSAASGFSSAVINAGEIRNRGMEILLQAIPVKREKFKWTTTVNFTKNNSLVLSLSDQVQRVQLGSQWNVETTAAVGLPYGAIFGYGIKKDSEGAPLLNSNGTFVRTDNQVYFGSINPDWRAGITNSIEVGNFTFSCLVDIKKGGKLYSATNMYLHGYAGNVNATLAGREEWYASEAARINAGVAGASTDENTLHYTSPWTPTGGYAVAGVYAPGANVNGEDVSGESANLYLNPQDYWSQFASWTKEIHEPFVYDASFVKLREMSIGYNLPDSFGAKIKLKNMRISVVGRNLWLIYSGVPNVDPEAAYTNGNGQGVEYATYPITRSIGINLNANF